MLILLFLLFHLGIWNGHAKEERFFVTSVNCGLDEQDLTASSIKVSGKEYSKQKDGINVIVYDIAKETVSQSKHFSDPNTKTFINFIQSILPGKLIIGTSQILCTKKSATNLYLQKSILYALRRLRFDTHDLRPIVFRGAVFAYCKESCYPNITSTVELPYIKVHEFRKGPILLSFRLNKVSTKEKTLLLQRSSQDNTTGDHLPHTTLYIIIVSCSVITVVSVCGIATCLVRRYKKDRQHWDVGKDTEKVRDRLGNTKRSCDLLFLSKEKSGCYQQQERYIPTTSARLFSLYSNENGQEEAGPMNGFASYVKVETDDRQIIYKVPSGVSKHDPPLHPPSLNPLLNKNSTIKTITSSNEYLTPHEYANPASRYGLRSLYQEVDPGLFEEYTSIDPPEDNEQYAETYDKYNNEPIYDNCQSDYIAP